MNTTFPSMIVVARAFGTYRKGDLITDPATIRAIMSGGNALHVVVPVLPAAASGGEQERH